MDKPVQLLCTLDQFDALHLVLHKAQGKGDFVKVNREALTKLMVDHSRLLARVPHRDPEGKEKQTKGVVR